MRHHPLGGGLDGEKDAGEVDIDLVLPVFERELKHRSAASNAGVGDGDIDPAQLLGAFVGGALDLVQRGDVALDDVRVAPEFAHQRGGFGCAVQVDVGDADIGAVAPQSTAVPRPMPDPAPVMNATRRRWSVSVVMVPLLYLSG